MRRFAAAALAALIAGCSGTSSDGPADETPPGEMNPALKAGAASAVRAFDTAPISQADARRQRGEALFVDTRAREEYAVSRVPGALFWDYKSTPEVPAEIRAAAEDGRPIIFYCSIGYRSGEAGDLAAQSCPAATFTNLEGGLFGWAETGGDLEGGDRVHPYDATWGKLLRADLRAPVE